MSGPDDVASLLARCLRATGATRAFAAGDHGFDLTGLEVVDVGDPALAALLADADGRLALSPAARPGVALLPGRRVRLSSQPGRQVLAQPVLDPADLPIAVAGWTVGQVHAAVELDVDLDLAAPAPGGLDPLTLGAADGRLTTLSPSLGSMAMALLVGPGVVRDGAVPGVAEAAARTGAAVVATPGAFGVLPLDHPAWRGVVGLQGDDLARSGLDEAELVVAAGLDPAESAMVPASSSQVLEVEPWHLELMAAHWDPPAPPAPATPGALVAAVAGLAAAGRDADDLPLHPARAVLDLAEALDPGVLVAADAGPAGLWLARGIVGRPAGSVVVPALPAPGFAAAAALVAGLEGRPAVAVVGPGDDPTTEAVLDLAAALGVTITLEVWGGEAGWSTASEHRSLLVGARHEGGVQRLAVPVDLGATAELERLLGPVVAWQGDPADRLA